MQQLEHRCADRGRFGVGMCILAAVLVSGCSSTEQGPVQSANRYGDAGMSDKTTAGSVSQQQTPAERLSQLVEQSRKDLASKLGVDASAITVAEARHVIWPDGSAGCAEPGYDYMQMLTEGVLIRLKADGRIFQYHAGTAGPAVHCAKPSPIDPPSKFEER